MIYIHRIVCRDFYFLLFGTKIFFLLPIYILYLHLVVVWICCARFSSYGTSTRCSKE